MAAKTFSDLIAELADRYGRYVQLTITGGSTTTIIDTGDLYQPDDYWIGAYAYVLTDAGGASAGPEGQERPITDFAQSTGTATVGAAFTAAPAVGDTVEFLPAQRAVLKRAINAAIVSAGTTWPIIKEDTTTCTVATNDYDMTLPTDIVRLIGVWYRDLATDPFKKLPGNSYRVGGTPGAQVLQMSTLDGLNIGDTLRLVYTARPSVLSAETDALDIGDVVETEFVHYIIEYALYWMYDRKAAQGDDYRQWMTSAQLHLENAQNIKKAATKYQPAGTILTARRSLVARG